ncbi:MAG: RluA family pseudouridine synthase [Eubacteriales bacterium]
MDSEILEILYLDRELIAVRKPVGIVSESTEKGDGLPDLLSEKLRKMGQSPMLYPLHRLDKGVSGVVLLARTKVAAAKMTAEIAAHHVEKEYLAVIHNRPAEASGEMFDLLYHDRVKNKSYVVDRMRGGVKDAELRYGILGSADTDDGELTLVRVELLTGRTHQIRIQFASRRMPLWGDDRYGRREKGNVALFCHQITFTHPGTGKIVGISSPPPNAYPWTLFRIGSDQSVRTTMSDRI